VPGDTFRDVLPEVRSVTFNHFEQVVDFELPLDADRSPRQTFQVEMKNLVYLIELYFFPQNTSAFNPLDSRYFMLRNRHWGRVVARDAAESNKYRCGPIVCQALDGEIVAFKISTDKKYLEFSVDGERPAFDGSKNFHFQIEHSDYWRHAPIAGKFVSFRS
jgi:hypothetical protein